jgi:hypothetical protein
MEIAVVKIQGAWIRLGGHEVKLHQSSSILEIVGTLVRPKAVPAGFRLRSCELSTFDGSSAKHWQTTIDFEQALC